MVQLSDLTCGQRAIVKKLNGSVGERLWAMGMSEGAEVEVLHELIGHDPIAVRVRGTLIGLRREEAANIEVEVRSERN